MKCPICKKESGLVTSIRQWDKEFGDVAGLPVMINLFCESCNENYAMAFIEKVAGFEVLESPLGPVQVPYM